MFASDPLAGLARSCGPPLGQGRLRARPEDFVVDEVLGFAPDGDGTHQLLRLRKRDLTTAAVAGRLAAFAGVRRRDVGFCGLKDRRALASQWFSVPRRSRPEPDWAALPGPGLELLECVAHGRKLRRGAHRGNRFSLRVRDLRAAPGALDARLRRLEQEGFPNYFGAQRFGADNLARARALLAGRLRLAPPARGMLYSALRAWLFNQLLSRRVADGTGLRAEPGDLMMLDGSHSIFVAEAGDPALAGRIAAADLHVSGPLWGRRRGAPTALEDREREVLRPWHGDCEGLERAGLAAARRALRARAHGLRWRFETTGALLLEFRLDPGVYATSLVRELLDERA